MGFFRYEFFFCSQPFSFFRFRRFGGFFFTSFFAKEFVWSNRIRRFRVHCLASYPCVCGDDGTQPVALIS